MGAGLPAMRSWLAKVVSVLMPSRATSAPTGFPASPQDPGSTRTLWERALPAMRPSLIKMVSGLKGDLCGSELAREGLQSSPGISDLSQLFQKTHQQAFFIPQSLARGRHPQASQFPRMERLDQRGMDVALAANSRGVAQLAGDFLDDRHHVFLCRGFRLPFQFPQQGQGQGTAGPSAVVLGGELGAGQFLQVAVDIAGGDAVALAVFVQVLEQLLAG